jgi:intraflagellar transport protein 74
MQSEVAMKERMLDHSQTTAERLATEEKERKGELEKIKNLDKKIDDELKSLRERRTTMTEELKKFGNIPQLREEAETNKRNMLARKRRLDGSRKSLKQQVQLLSSEYDKQKQALATNESAGALEALEGQLRHHEQNIYHLKDFIDRKEAETDYTGVYQEVSEQVYDINVLLQQLHSAFN